MFGKFMRFATVSGIVGIGFTGHCIIKNPVLSDIRYSLEYKHKTKDSETTTLSDKTYKYIVVGAGSSGCITAYFLAKWMQDAKIAGDVLLIDSGNDYFVVDGPKPDLWSWYENWCNFSVLHNTLGENSLPATGSSHIGVGGCSTHDTRITYAPTQSQSERLADSMGWTSELFNTYMQAALNMMPLQTTAQNEPFYDAVIKTLSDNKVLQGVKEYKAKIIEDSVGYVSVAMYPDELRWTCAYLLHDSIRPSNLKVLANTPVDKIIIDRLDYPQDLVLDYDIRLNYMRQRWTYKAKGVLTSTGKEIKLSNHNCMEKQSEVIITAGSLGTPAILQRSGIGNKIHLNDIGIDCILNNPEIGHGVDHAEIAVMYSWNGASDSLPRGGPMAWPLAMFFNDVNKNIPDTVVADTVFNVVTEPTKASEQAEPNVMVHFGTSGPPYGGNVVIGTPNCTKPDPQKGFYAQIKTKNPNDPIEIFHLNSDADFDVLKKGVRKMVNVFEQLRQHGIVGDRVEPNGFDINDDTLLEQWIRPKLGTAYHWMSTVKAGKSAKWCPVDTQFQLKGISGLRIGSGAVLPEITGANPHLTITAFSIALAHNIFAYENATHQPIDFLKASAHLQQNNGKLKIRRHTEEYPNLYNIAKLQRDITSPVPVLPLLTVVPRATTIVKSLDESLDETPQVNQKT